MLPSSSPDSFNLSRAWLSSTFPLTKSRSTRVASAAAAAWHESDANWHIGSSHRHLAMQRFGQLLEFFAWTNAFGDFFECFMGRVDQSGFESAGNRLQEVLAPEALRSLLDLWVIYVFRMFSEPLPNSGLSHIDRVPDWVRFALFG
jgi:hypothetical protein